MGAHYFGILVFGVVAVIGLSAGDNVKTMLEFCCTSGEELADQGGNCSDFKPPANVSHELLSSCFFSSDICCTAKLRIEHCKAGVLAGKEGLDCRHNGTDAEFYTGCCEACKIGLVVGATESECPLPFMYGAMFDESYTYCCREMNSSFYLVEGQDLCRSFDRLCSQICVNTDESYVCQCEPGFHLIDDKRTCVPDGDEASKALSNEVTSDFPNLSGSSECLPGYLYNEETYECEDMNECDASGGDCDLDSQVCYNTPGSYICMDIVPVAESICGKGLRYNAKNQECDDINECLEQTHDCDPSAQLCMNTRGSYQCQDRVHVTCMVGFQPDKGRQSCEDINECEGDHKCPPNTECENIQGGFNCMPKKRIEPAKTPARVNPLIQSSRRKTSCASGFKAYMDKCVDIDECTTTPRACASNQNCINTPGGFVCQCKVGFTLDTITGACTDINECQINNHDCLDTQRCDNTIGSYSCIRMQSCGTGYTLNAGTALCDDDDECVLNRHNCLPPYECRNTKGSFRCERPRTTTPPPTTRTPSTTTTTTTTTLRPALPTARRVPVYTTYPTYNGGRTTPNPPSVHETRPSYGSSSSSHSNREYDRYLGPCSVGMERNENGACVDVDECLAHPCRRNQKCINSNGSYRCVSLLTCSGGYQSNDDGTQCVDIDECESNLARCSPGQTCQNKPGGYTCTCPPGHIYKNRRCEDIDECQYYKGQVCPLNAKCHNTIGSYRCDCLKGFRKNNDEDKVCQDVDECSEQVGLCSQRCVNIWGSFRCACDNGYELASNNRTCQDIDECEVHKAYNLCMGICENTPGSFQCTCPDGYRLAADGRSCQDIDECESRQVCYGHHEICTNVRGSYRCTPVDCPPDYMRDPDKKNRCKRISLLCESGDIECYMRPSSFTYNFVTIAAKTALPPQGRGLFTLKGPSWYEHIDFDFRIVDVRSGLSQRVDDRFFKLTKMHNEVVLSLMQTLEGPQDIEAELKMTAYRDGQPSGTNVQKIFIIVSEFSY